MLSTKRVLISVLSVLLLSGCAGVNVSRVTADDQQGVRYWRPAPHVALAPVTANGATTCEAKLVMLPDKSEEYAITMTTGLWGSAEANPSLQDGWNLTGLSGKADSKTAETITAFASLLKVLPDLGLQPLSSTKKNGGRPAGCGGLYRIEFDKYGRAAGFTRLGGLPVVALTPPAPKPDPKQCGKPGQPACDK